MSAANHREDRHVVVTGPRPFMSQRDPFHCLDAMRANIEIPRMSSNIVQLLCIYSFRLHLSSRADQVGHPPGLGDQAVDLASSAAEQREGLLWLAPGDSQC